jgi:hypothetical protein
VSIVSVCTGGFVGVDLVVDNVLVGEVGVDVGLVGEDVVIVLVDDVLAGLVGDDVLAGLVGDDVLAGLVGVGLAFSGIDLGGVIRIQLP